MAVAATGNSTTAVAESPRRAQTGGAARLGGARASFGEVIARAAKKDVPERKTDAVPPDERPVDDAPKAVESPAESGKPADDTEGPKPTVKKQTPDDAQAVAEDPQQPAEPTSKAVVPLPVEVEAEVAVPAEPTKAEEKPKEAKASDSGAAATAAAGGAAAVVAVVTPVDADAGKGSQKQPQGGGADKEAAPVQRADGAAAGEATGKAAAAGNAKAAGLAVEASPAEAKSSAAVEADAPAAAAKPGADAASGGGGAAKFAELFAGIGGGRDAPVQTDKAPAAVPVSREAAFAEANEPRIVESVRTTAGAAGAAGRGEMTLRLDPPEIGALEIKVTMQGGTVSADFGTANPDAARLLTHTLGRLKDALELAGLPVDRLTVSQSPRNEGGGAGAGQEGRGGGAGSHTSPGGAGAETDGKREQQRRDWMERLWRRVSGDDVDLVA